MQRAVSQHQCQQNALPAARRQRLGQAAYLPSLLIALLLLLQQVEVHMCRQLMASDKRLERLKDTSSTTATGRQHHKYEGSAAADFDLAALDKRSEAAAAAPTLSQPEEIFSLTGGDASSASEMDTNYDEYPMIVPKRAALLLDRLMVALHHALEHERSAHRISDFYANKNMINMKPKEYLEQPTTVEDGNDSGANANQNSNANMNYSEDDPDAIMDYDFKDLNQINRATGETLMAKSFQRRAGSGVGGGSGSGFGFSGATDGIALLTNAGGGVGGGGGGGAAAGNMLSGAGRRLNLGGVGSGGGGGGGGGRVYWRCYFNAVSCF